MPRSYYPQADDAFEAYLTALLVALPGVMTALGLAATFDDALIAAKTTYANDLSDHHTQQLASFSARQTKEASKAAVILQLQLVHAALEADPDLTDAMRVSLGWPPRDTVPSPSVPGVDVPVITVDTSHPQRHTIGFGRLTDEGEFAKGKPAWARALRIVYAVVPVGSPCPGIETMLYLASDTAPPYVWDIAVGNVGKDIWYRGAFETTSGELGPWSDPAKGTVTG
ncbi:MAG: hypothetical protein ABL962_01940 [Fimbriimonadaceae bacterium]